MYSEDNLEYKTAPHQKHLGAEQNYYEPQQFR